MKIYIAGKITGLVYEDALRAFADAEALLTRLGHEPVNPMKVEPEPDLPWAEYMKRDIPHLLGCDAIYLLPNRVGSKGAVLEHAIAHELGMEIMHAVDIGGILPANNANGREMKPDEWIECQSDGCSEKFIQTDPDAEVDLCPSCDAALMRAMSAA